MSESDYRDEISPELDKYLDVFGFFKGQDVFITGGTGFMGNVLIEKLLWVCEDIGNIYLLLREKKKKTIEERLQEFLNLSVFERVKNRNPKTLEKIIPIQGDVGELNLGISNDDIRTLEKNVSVVFHFAATVRFTESMKKAILMNVRGTREVVDLARNMKNLQALVHVSTIYANTNQTTIEEKVYSIDKNWRTMIKIAENLDEIQINELQHKIIGFHPNTYTYTKSLAEHVVNEFRKEIPVVIFRPSIVTCSISDPSPGYTHYQGSSTLWLAIVTGVIHVMYARENTAYDYIPCDHCANGLIISACYRGKSKVKECITINAASGETRKTDVLKLARASYRALEFVPLEKTLWEPGIVAIENYFLYFILLVLLHLIPSLFFDLYFKMSGIKFNLFETYKKIYIVNTALKIFSINEWIIKTDNYQALSSYIHPSERPKFKMDFASIDDDKLIGCFLIGVKKYYFKEEFTDEKLQKARLRRKRLHTFDLILKALFGILFIWMAYYLAKVLLSKTYEYYFHFY